MTDIILKNFPDKYEVYVEGFGGGGSVLFAKEPEGMEIYNDLGSNSYSLFKVLSSKEMYERFKDRLDLTYYSSEIREEFKKELLRDDLDIEDRAYYYFYVNRTSFNGVGGFSRTLLVRRKMSKSVSDYLSAIDGLPEVHDRISRVIVENEDIFDLIDRYDSGDVFFYFDPPYIKSTRSSSTKYEIEMDEEGHRKLVNRLREIKGRFLLSGYRNVIYDEVLKGYERVDFKSPNSNSERIESLWKNY